VTIAALEAEAVALIDSAIEQLERALRAFQSGDARLARGVVTASRRNRAGADGVYESTLALLGEGPPPAADVRRRAALLHVVARIRHIQVEVAAIAQVAGDPPAAVGAASEQDRALGLMGELTLSRLARARDAFAGRSSELAAEMMATAPELGLVSAPVLLGPAVGVARCLERIEDDAIEIGEQVMFVSSGFFQELADSPWLGDGPTRSAVPAP
jgi:phosphate transport system protein